jgi:hypothetical protein
VCAVVLAKFGKIDFLPLVYAVVFSFLDFNSSLDLSLVFGAIWQNRLSSSVHLAPTVLGFSSF